MYHLAQLIFFDTKQKSAGSSFLMTSYNVDSETTSINFLFKENPLVCFAH
jgi:hypothetical protein